MIDFIEYVVSELKSKRLSKNNALALIQQFTLHSSSAGKASVIHPLLHKNTSDIRLQKYSSTFTGGEFFLADHQLKIDGAQGQRVLPGVAYLEMARAAVEQALPTNRESNIIELHNTVWAQPVVVRDNKEVSIVLGENDSNQIAFEIYSTEGGQEIVHCQGSAVYKSRPETPKLDIDKLKEQMQRGNLEPGSIYHAYTRMGIDYGPAHRGVATVFLGEKQLLAKLKLPASLKSEQNDYLLHPSLMDSALQSAIGLIAEADQILQKPFVPFNLKSLRILSGCTEDGYAWVRYSPGCQPEDRIIKLDIDLCDSTGDVCVQMREFSSRVLATVASVDESHAKTVGTMIATPAWQPSTITRSSETRKLEYAQQHIILCETHQANAKQLGILIPHSQCLPLEAGPDKSIAERYNEYALACFEHIREIITKKPQGKILVQIVIPASEEERAFVGLSGLLKTAVLENPQIDGQIILTDPEATIVELADQLKYDRTRPQDTIIGYFQGARHILTWNEIEPNQAEPKLSFNDQGVYLITGGLGGLGLLFSKEILNQTTKARIILTGRSELTGSKRAILELLPDPSRVDYRQLDITDQDQVNELIISIKREYNQLNGIIHSAGMISDSFILKKTSEEFKQVLAPKVFGTFNLDRASKHIDLDFIAFFSSGVSVTGNSGQSDYATANGFMDQFASYRNLLVEAGQRKGREVPAHPGHQ